MCEKNQITSREITKILGEIFQSWKGIDVDPLDCHAIKHVSMVKDQYRLSDDSTVPRKIFKISVIFFRFTTSQIDWCAHHINPRRFFHQNPVRVSKIKTAARALITFHISVPRLPDEPISFLWINVSPRFPRPI